MTSHEDQVVAAVREVELLCGGNVHLMNDVSIERRIELAANGRHTVIQEIVTHGHPLGAAHVRVLSAKEDGDARLARYERRDVDTPSHRPCDRCDRRYETSKGRWLWVPTGTSAVEFGLCLMCVDFLNESFDPVVWR